MGGADTDEVGVDELAPGAHSSLCPPGHPQPREGTMANAASMPQGVEIRAAMRPGYDAVLTPDALAFVAALERKFGAERQPPPRRARRAPGASSTPAPGPNSRPRPARIREADWTVAPLPKDLLDRRVEITGPTDRKMVINALNSGANVYHGGFRGRQHADLGQSDRRPDQSRATRSGAPSPSTIRRAAGITRCSRKIATLLVRPRGWHLPEAHVLVDGAPMSGSLFDFGLYFFHNAKELLARGTGPYFYLPKIESRHEAKLWNDVFVESQQPARACRAARSRRRC